MKETYSAKYDIIKGSMAFCDIFNEFNLAKLMSFLHYNDFTHVNFAFLFLS